MRCDTVWIDAERALVHLVWRGLADVASPTLAGKLVVAAETRAREVLEHDLGADAEQLDLLIARRDVEEREVEAPGHGHLVEALGPQPGLGVGRARA